MKLFKNLFNGKKDKNSKNEPNTLAEANGSPDMRLATKKEKEESVPKIKKEETKKEPKILIFHTHSHEGFADSDMSKPLAQR